ncbi:MAG: Sec-independent protein translocase protein TatB [Thermodesulfovibrionales bacterium]
MFDIGFQELVIIFVVALLVVGPEKLPELSRTLGKWVVEIRRGVNLAKIQMESEFREIAPEVKGDAALSFRSVESAESPSAIHTTPEKTEDDPLTDDKGKA